MSSPTEMAIDPQPTSPTSSSCASWRSSSAAAAVAASVHGDDFDADDGGSPPRFHGRDGPAVDPSSDPLPAAAPANSAPGGRSDGGRESLLRFLLLPSQVGVVLLLEFLNSFRGFGMRFVFYNYITNEFGVGDARAGILLGVKGYVDIAFGLLGSILVDLCGVRKVSVAAFSVAIVGRTLLAFGRTTGALYLAMFFFSPIGEALLSVGLYKVALKKLTTPLTRPLAFAMSYASFNLAGAFADILIDKMRDGLEDLTIDKHFVGIAGVYTPLRQFVVVTWAVVLLTFIIAYCFLEDWTVIDTNDPEEDDLVQQRIIREMNEVREVENDNPNDGFVDGHINLMPAKPMVKPHLLRRWFPEQYQSIHNDDDGRNEGADRLPVYKMYRTQLTASSGGNTSLAASLWQFANQVISLLRMRATWRVLIFGFASFTIAMNWTASEMLMPPFFERRFGESVPIYTIQSINLFGCLILPPIVGAMTGKMEDFSIVMPGLWIMAISPVFMALSPNVLGACLWQLMMTIGEVMWSPRLLSWTASLAPTGSEGLFFAIGSARAIIGPLTDVVMGALNEKYNANCPDCRDQYGHFCTVPQDDSLQCASVQESCDFYLENEQQSCPESCPECPTWEPTNPSTCWYFLTLASLITPISVWAFLPFLRGKYNREDNCYGLFSLTRTRLFGICGAAEDGDINQRRVDGRQIYGHVETESYFGSGVGKDGIVALGVNVELT